MEQARSASRLPAAPQLDPAALRPGPDLYDLFNAQEDFDLDEPIGQDALLEGQDVSYTTGRGVEFTRCVLRRCCFRGARWKAPSFTDVIFEGCDFSNARFPDAYFQRVRFIDCKLVGADLINARLRNAALHGCLMRMINLSGAKLNLTRLVDCDMQEAALQSLAELKFVSLDRCNLTRAELLGTRLNGLDLTTCRLDGILLSGQTELRGAIVSPLQALELSRLMGLVIRDE